MRGKAIVAMRRILGRGRPADAIIIGGQRCGTRSLFQYLSQHPEVATAARAEVHYFDLNHDRGSRWYAAHFSPGPGRVRVEASPYYIFHPLAAERIARDLPDARFLVLLRDPISRAYSHYQMMVDKGREVLSFEEALAREDERIAGSPSNHRNFSYRTRGLYADQLERWLKLFPRDRFLITISDEMFDDGPVSVDRICDFLGVSRYNRDAYRQWNARSYPPIPDAVRAKLDAFYRPHNLRLADLLGRELPW